MKALDPATGETKWDFRYYRAPWGGTLSTSGGLIFSGDEDGYFMAFDARTGKNLWRMNTGSAIKTAPITYMAGGRQYVSMPSGGVVLTFALPEGTEAEASKPTRLTGDAPAAPKPGRRIE